MSPKGSDSKFKAYLRVYTLLLMTLNLISEICWETLRGCRRLNQTASEKNKLSLKLSTTLSVKLYTIINNDDY